ncbi:MAG: hypothetical protein GVY22_10795 [Gammaproteobacteria bacterium]|jgi:hypothetical protein|nr:hypothetical protein [Gammaproteobacteria bacterium]
MSESAEFNRVTFGLPVETFRVSAHIALDERLPVVTEFVLRLLRICGHTSLADLRDYFGFNDSEALSLIESLSRQGLIAVNDEDVRLTPFSNERFDEAGGDHPRFSKVELKQDTVTFDLRSFTPLRTGRGSLPSDNIIKLDAEEEALGNSLERAKNAYRQRYPEIASMRDDLREKSYGVYAVEDIESKKRSYVPVPVAFSLDAEGQVIRSLDEAFELVAPQELLHFFNEQVTASIPRTLSLKNRGLEEFIDTFNVQVMRRYLVGNKFDLSGYLSDVHFKKSVKFSNGMTPILGNLYLPENRERIVSRLNDRRAGRRRHGKLLTSLAWLVPEYELWGRGDSFALTVSAFCGALREKGSVDDLYVLSTAERGTEAAVTNRFRVNGLRELHFFRSQAGDDLTMNGRVEIVLYPTAFVAVVFHADIPGATGLRIPVGFFSTLPKHLNIAHKLLCQIMGTGRYGGRARFRAADAAEGKFSFEDACSFLNFDSLPSGRSAEEAAGALSDD